MNGFYSNLFTIKDNHFTNRNWYTKFYRDFYKPSSQSVFKNTSVKIQIIHSEEQPKEILQETFRVLF